MALTADRDTPQVVPSYSFLREFPVAAGKTIYAGGLVVLKNGYAEPGSTATGLVAVGRAEEYVDNSGGQNGDVTVRVRRGIFRYGNSADTDAITRTDIGSQCYVVDDETVAKTDGTGTRSVAGKVFDVDDEGVWVEFTN
ncbi:hypothetical protein [Thermodesulforhabdus norvegica]|uniref:DUF2190 family protein n=1 Tax=Thermodesulforhabdus norvegica TaxID=39841 RepID=A0A1I4SV08_9BACT|nr:hypothetical protein [Thermodesulforhabdus norvegica]SFM68170.1 hypothetical protein SAMN05660836_01174 [Thermodesulforhabdus norvegica]